MSRSLGDFAPEMGRKLHGVIADPDVRTELLQDEDEFLLLASDGIFDVLPTDRAMATVRSSLEFDSNPTEAAEKLLQEALDRNADDNCSVLVVCFKELPRVERVRPRLFGKRG